MRAKGEVMDEIEIGGRDVYSEIWLDSGVENDELKGEEAGFMLGWLAA